MSNLSYISNISTSITVYYGVFTIQDLSSSMRTHLWRLGGVGLRSQASSWERHEKESDQYLILQSSNSCSHCILCGMPNLNCRILREMAGNGTLGEGSSRRFYSLCIRSLKDLSHLPSMLHTSSP